MKKLILLIPIFILLISCGKTPNTKKNTNSNITNTKITTKDVSTNTPKTNNKTSSNKTTPSKGGDVFEDTRSYGPLH